MDEITQLKADLFDLQLQEADIRRKIKAKLDELNAKLKAVTPIKEE